MDRFVIQGGSRLEGELAVNGSKNAALPLMAASLLTDKPVRLTGLPDLADTRNMLRLLAELGVEPVPGERSVTLTAADDSESHARYDIVRTMRASVCVLGPMLARRGHAKVSMPGGCAIGERPIDLHLRGLEALGAKIELDGGDITATAPTTTGTTNNRRLRGATVFMGGPYGSTVLGTANVMSAATLAEGETVIESAACEPEIVALADLLRGMGARITGDGSPRVRIEGVESLGGAERAVIPDRIEAATLICAAGITNGDLILRDCPLDALLALTDRLDRVGVHVRPIDDGAQSADPMRRTVRVTADRRLQPVEVTTQPHPGFPTDAQAQLMALLCLADGNSVITEKVFPERFLHVAELTRMGARLHRQGATVVVSGVPELRGAPVMASDLRASAGLVLAGLAARGTTTVNRVYHLDRGYEQLERRLAEVGARIEREPGE